MRGQSYYSTAHVHRIQFLAMLYTWSFHPEAVQHIEQEELVNGGIIFG